MTFYKPQGNLNMHAGYADIDSGDRHIANVIAHLERGPQWNNMVVIVTHDEKRRLVGSREPARRRPLGAGLADSNAGRLAVREEGRRRSHGL
ncbi:MAG: alkaline phosphatase family protein [Pararobbsia sp.]